MGLNNIYLEKSNLKKEDLIYQLIFSEEESFEIKVSEYTQDIYKYDRFINEIKDILKKSKVVISKEKVDLEEDCVLWSLTVKRK
jgi:UDP-N-acetylglucosamine:LPS N-acetylglucosamine transferase